MLTPASVSANSTLDSTYITDQNVKLFLHVRTSNKVHWIAYSDIIFLKSDSNYTYIYWTGGRILSAKTLKTYSEIILLEDNFIKTHRSFIVNKDFIKLIDKKKKSFQLIDNTTIPISKFRYKKLKNLLS